MICSRCLSIGIDYCKYCGSINWFHPMEDENGK